MTNIRTKKFTFSKENAEKIALLAFDYIAGDAQETKSFLDVSGLTPQQIREAAAEPGFLRGVLEFMLMSDSRILTFCERYQIDPQEINLCLSALDEQSAEN